MNEPDREGGPPTEDSHSEPHGPSVSESGNVLAESGCLTRLEIAELACKILAVWILAHAALSITPLLLFLGAAAFQLNPGEAFTPCAVMGAVPLGELIVGVLLWRNAKAIGRRMVRDQSMPVTRIDLDTEHLMTIAFAVIGIYAVWASSAGVLQKAAEAFYMSQMQGIASAAFWADMRWNASLIGTLGSLAFGVWLVFGSRGIVRFVRRIPGNGQTSSEDIAGHGGATS